MNDHDYDNLAPAVEAVLRAYEAAYTFSDDTVSPDFWTPPRMSRKTHALREPAMMQLFGRADLEVILVRAPESWPAAIADHFPPQVVYLVPSGLVGSFKLSVAGALDELRRMLLDDDLEADDLTDDEEV